MNNDFKINLPKNKFNIKKSLYKNENLYLEEWLSMNIYKNINLFTCKKKQFFLHDGPPFANGNIHLGHAVNKILKDIIIKFKKMCNYYIKFYLGWDCHGLPIELKVKQQQNNKNFFQICNLYVEQQITIQKNSFLKLGILNKYKKFYYTSNKNYEYNVLLCLIEIIKNDFLIYKKKPISWCYICQSTLSDSELKIKNIKSKNLYFSLPIINYIYLEKKLSFYKNFYSNIEIIFFTNEIWLLPINTHIFIYYKTIFYLIKIDDKLYLIYDFIKNNFIKMLKKKEYTIIGIISSKYLHNLYIYNILLKKNIKINITNNNIINNIQFLSFYHEKYFILNKHNIIQNYLSNKGFYKNKFKNFNIFNSFNCIKKIFNKKNQIFITENIIIEYNFCWRHYIPVFNKNIYQLYIKINNNIKKNIILKINQFKDQNIKNKIINNLNTRPDWCISRQRNWGLQIPFFINKKTKKLHPNSINIIQKIIKNIKFYGKNFFKKIKINNYIIDKNKEYKKYNSILDVWFESACSLFCYQKKFNINTKADILCEGNDQFRGWFISSIILSIIINNSLPCKNLISHGFVLDSKKQKMSKSLSNVIDPFKIIKEYGVDILRLWISLCDYNNDIIISQESIKYSVNIYKKIRNTIKFILSNMTKQDFIKEKNNINILNYDTYILNTLYKLNINIFDNYNNNKFRKVIDDIYNYCIFLSTNYFDIIKDRLYLLNIDHPARKSIMFVFINLINYFLRWIFPVLSFTAYEITKYLPISRYTIFTFKWLNNKEYKNNFFWKIIYNIKDRIDKFINLLRIKKIINDYLELELYIFLSIKYYFYLKFLNKELKFLFKISKVKIFIITKKKLFIFYKKTKLPKCIRCWNRALLYENNICNRCKNILLKKEIRFII